MRRVVTGIGQHHRQDRPVLGAVGGSELVTKQRVHRHTSRRREETREGSHLRAVQRQRLGWLGRLLPPVSAGQLRAGRLRNRKQNRLLREKHKVRVRALW